MELTCEIYWNIGKGVFALACTIWMAIVKNSLTTLGFEPTDSTSADLSKEDIIVAGGRRIQKQANRELIAQALGGEYGVTPPVADARWTDYQRQIGTTGQPIAPKLYIACGVSGAIQHTAALKSPEFVVAIHTDPDAPIRNHADTFVQSDLNELLPELIQQLTNKR